MVPARTPREIRLNLSREPIPTTIPLTSRVAGGVMQGCDCCFGMYSSDNFDFEHGLCAKCSSLLVPRTEQSAEILKMFDKISLGAERR